MAMTPHKEPTEIHVIPAEHRPQGLRILALRQFRDAGAPPALAIIDQHILRKPVRNIRQGVFFAATFRPEIMDWLISQLGYPSLHDETGKPSRNPRWPALTWQSEEELWPDGTGTTEWYVDIAFADDGMAALFRQQWRERLEGRMEPGEDRPATSGSLPRNEHSTA